MSLHQGDRVRGRRDREEIRGVEGPATRSGD